jgi:hypothetical protein
MFRLIPHPTFAATVQITDYAAEALVEVELVFRHKSNSEIIALQQRTQTEQLTDLQVLMAVIEDWTNVVSPDDQAVPFEEQALAQLLDHYPAAGAEIWSAYLKRRRESLAGN